MNDLKFAFRQLLRKPGFTNVAMLTLAFTSLLSAQPQASVSETNKPDFSKARQFIQADMVKWSIPSISVNRRLSVAFTVARMIWRDSECFA